MNYEECIKYNQSIQVGATIKPGLESITNLLQMLGNPQKDLKFIHIAGTNGKGSTASFISSALSANGVKVGRYVSPAVFSNLEKIQYTQDGSITYVTEEEYAHTITQIRVAIELLQNKNLAIPTEFEIETAASFLLFKKWNCDVVVLETGMGGRLDATNIVENVECVVITSISMDHMKFLGDTIEKIAYEKSGIIKKNVPVVTCQHDNVAFGVIRDKCMELNSELSTVNQQQIFVHEQNLNEIIFDYGDYHDVSIPLIGDYQIENAALALECISKLKNRYSINSKDVLRGFSQTKWPGRFDVISTTPVIVADGAHNPDGIFQLCKSIDTHFSNVKRIGIMGVFSDKNFEKMSEMVEPLFDTIMTITPPTKRGLSSKILSDTINKYARKDKATPFDNFEDALKCAENTQLNEDCVILIFGSLSIMKQAYQIVLSEE